MNCGREDLMKLPASILVEDLLYYKQDHDALNYIAEELSKLGINPDKPLHMWMVDFVRTHKENGL